MEDQIFFTTGALKDKVDKRDLHLASITAPVLDKPKKFILKDLFPSKNQYSLGSCTSQAQTHHKERQEKVKLAARFVMALTKMIEGNTQYGAYTRNSFKVVNKYGACEETLYPETGSIMSWEEYIDHTKIPEACLANGLIHKSHSYWSIANNIPALKDALLTYGPKDMSVVVSMKWYREFNRPENGVLPYKFEAYVGGHAIELIGFDDDTRLLTFKNSWSEAWGDKGNFHMPYDIFSRVMMDAWISLDVPAEVAVDVFYHQKRTWTSFLREQAMAFNPWLRKKIGRLPNNREIKGLAYGFWEYEAIFEGKYGDIWLHHTKPEAVQKGLI